MTAWKCDRCGKYFETKSEDSDNFERYQDVMQIVRNVLEHNLTEKVDLCPSCLTSFVKWFRRIDENED